MSNIFDIILNFLSLIGDYLLSGATFVIALLGFIPNMFINIFNNLPSFIKFGLVNLISIIVIIIGFKFISIVKGSIK